MTTTFLLHIMLRHSADAMANAILDGCADVARGCMRLGFAAAARVASVATIRLIPARYLGASSHA